MMKYIYLILLLIFIPLHAAIEFDAVDDLIDCGAQNQLDDVSALTVIVWANFGSAGEGGGTYIGKGIAGASGWFLDLFTDKSRFFHIGSTGLARDSTAITADYGVWTRYLTTWDGSITATNVHLYRDGSELSYFFSRDGVALVSDASDNLLIGNRNTTNNTIDGIIACVAIWEGELDSNAIESLVSTPCRTALKIRGDILRFYAELDGGRDGAASANIINLVDGSTCTATNTPTARAAPIAR